MLTLDLHPNDSISMFSVQNVINDRHYNLQNISKQTAELKFHNWNFKHDWKTTNSLSWEFANNRNTRFNLRFCLDSQLEEGIPPEQAVIYLKLLSISVNWGQISQSLHKGIVLNW